MPKNSTKLIEGRDYTVSSGNIFADLGLPNPEDLLLRAQCVTAIDNAIREKKLTQAAAAKKLGIHQPDLSRLLGGQLRRYSLGRLLHFLIALDQDVTITVKSKKDKPKRVNFELHAAE
ncbi:MAG: XRE family transcriptional regulator [Beijerinckiaceae bacterium]|nr:XRE family transcriptional regulator [Beijerinckiaceae bacterium]